MKRLTDAAIFAGGIALLGLFALLGAADERMRAIRDRRKYTVLVCPAFADADDALNWFHARGVTHPFLWRGDDGLVRGSGVTERKTRRERS